MSRGVMIHVVIEDTSFRGSFQYVYETFCLIYTEILSSIIK